MASSLLYKKVNASKPKSTLAKNTAYLYALSLSSQLISVLTIPYQTRVLSPELYGVIGFLSGIMGIVGLGLNYGFLYSATEKVAIHIENIKVISIIYSAVLYSKILIAIILAIVSLPLVLLIPILNEYRLLYALYFIAYIMAGLLPDYLYRGIEKMKIITIRTVAVRLLSASLIFLFIRSDADAWVLPASLLLGNGLALICCLWFDKRKLGIELFYPNRVSIAEEFRDGAPFFVSRIASTFYQSGNAIVLGFVFPGQIQVGWYNATDKVLSVVKQISSPVADSIYPYMIKRHDYRLAIKILVFSSPVILICAVIAIVCADDICCILFGSEYSSAGDVLRCMVPAMMVIFPTYIICFPMLVPMGLSKQANRSNVVGMAAQILILAVLLISDNLNVYTVCMGASISEVLVFVYRLCVLVKYRSRMN